VELEAYLANLKETTPEVPHVSQSGICYDLPGLKSVRGDPAKELAYAFMNKLHPETEGAPFTHTSLKSLYLDANGLTSVSANAIADYFRYKTVVNQPGIELLSLSINRFGDEGAKEIVESLYVYPIKSLTLGSNRIELSGLQSILKWASQASTLQVLDIGYYKATADMGELPNSFGDEGAKEIVESLYGYPIKSLTLGSNR
jgi:hypothetical protein